MYEVLIVEVSLMMINLSMKMNLSIYLSSSVFNQFSLHNCEEFHRKASRKIVFQSNKNQLVTVMTYEGCNSDILGRVRG